MMMFFDTITVMCDKVDPYQSLGKYDIKKAGTPSTWISVNMAHHLQQREKYYRR